MAWVYPTKARAKSFCARKNKNARKYRYVYEKRDKGGYLVYKRKK